jgi:hypothetical protein
MVFNTIVMCEGSLGYIRITTVPVRTISITTATPDLETSRSHLAPPKHLVSEAEAS